MLSLAIESRLKDGDSTVKVASLVRFKHIPRLFAFQIIIPCFIVRGFIPDFEFREGLSNH